MSTIELPIKGNNLVVKAVTYKSHKTPLTIKEIQIPITPGNIVKPYELLIKIKATSINPVDCVLKGANYGWFGDRVIGSDFSGIVIKAGDKTKYENGDLVFGNFFTFFGRGPNSEYMLLDTRKRIILEKIPNGMTFEQAASLPVVSGTALQCLNYYKNSLEGKNVLVLGAGTSVGTYTVQFAKNYFKAGKVVATCSPNSSEKITKCGADVIIDYTKGNTSKNNEILEFVKVNGKFDIIVDTVRDETVFGYFHAILKPYKEGGILTQVEGSYTIDYTKIKITDFLPSWKKISAGLKYKFGLSKYEVVSVLLNTDKGYGDVINALFNSDKLIFSIDAVKDAYTEAQAAYERVASGKAKGKVVLKYD
jgi:NADPH:quinone reductase-like Zn-dependent oxidoreductase